MLEEQGHREYVHTEQEGSLGNQPLPEGNGSKGPEALGQVGGRGRDCHLPLWNLTPVSQIPSWVVQGQRKRERERGGQRLPQEPWQREGLQSSVIPLALSSSCTLVR